MPPTTTRRHFISTAALAAMAPLTHAAASDLSKDCIDAHVHVWTPDTERYPLAEGFTKAKDMLPPSFTPEELLAHARPMGVNRIVLIQMSFYKFDNRYMLDTMAQYAGVFSGVAIVDEQKSDLRETMKALASKGVRGFRLYTDRAKAEAWKDSEAMKSMWSHGADLGQAMCLLANPDALPAVQQMCKAFPKTRVVIDHFARMWDPLESTCRHASLSIL